MSLIQVQNLSFSYEGSSEPVFDRVSFHLDTRWRLGVTGRNGKGKTTFLKLLSGELDHNGAIQTQAVCDYFPFPVPHPELDTWQVLDQVTDGEAQLWEIQRELSQLQAEEEILYRPFQTLSKGEQTKALLAALFLRQGHFLLIDEPTNHLDQEARTAVSRYLSKREGFILVSHDRAFLDGCVDHILALNRQDIELQQGNFSSWYENRKRQDAFEQAENNRLKRDIRRLEEGARQSGKWADQAEASKIGRNPKKQETFIGTRAYLGEKSRRMQQQRKNIERRQERAIQEKKELLKNVETVESLKLFPLSYHSQRLVVLEQVSACYGNPPIPVSEPVTMEIRNGDRICLRGKNGCGKSSLFRLILGEQTEAAGKLWRGSGLKISYVSQDTSHLRGSLREYARAFQVEEHLICALLRKLDFSREQLEKPLEALSQGQKKKVLIARSLCEQAHLYLWDEPLNYVDVYSRIQIEELILKFQPTMVFVEHDAEFADRVADQILMMNPAAGRSQIRY